MVNASLTGAHLLRNNSQAISRLAELFYISFDYFATHASPMDADFVQEIRTIAGLGFVACLVDEGHVMPYQSYLNYFLNHSQGDFRKHSRQSKLLAESLAHMVVLGNKSFRMLRNPICPDYYQAFINAIKKATMNIRTNMAGKNEQARQLIKQLQCGH